MRFNPYASNMAFTTKQDQCFVVMPFGQDWSSPIWNDVKSVCSIQRLVAVRGDDRLGSNILDDIWRALNESRVVIVDTTGRNPNVMYELGLAHALRKEVILLAQHPDEIPFDLKVLRHILYDPSDAGRIVLRETLSAYLSDIFFSGPDNFGRTIGHGDFVLLFLSTGGTCRCAMSNLIVRYLLARNKSQREVEDGPMGLKPMSAALSEMSCPQMSDLAQSVVLKRLGISGQHHKTLKLTTPLLRRADLLLPMAKGLMKAIPEEYQNKTRLFKEYFGLSGDIADPWGGTENDYNNCFDQLISTLSSNTQVLATLSSQKNSFEG